jgi:hypothetical protein
VSGKFFGGKSSEKSELFSEIFFLKFARNGLYLCTHPKKNRGKNVTYGDKFRGNFRGISGGFPGDFFRKKLEFRPDFARFLWCIYCFTERVLTKTPKIPEVFRRFPKFRKSRGKIFPEILRNSPVGFFSEIFGIL